VEKKTKSSSVFILPATEILRALIKPPDRRN